MNDQHVNEMTHLDFALNVRLLDTLELDLESEWEMFDNVEFWQAKVVFVGMLYKKFLLGSFLQFHWTVNPFLHLSGAIEEMLHLLNKRNKLFYSHQPTLLLLSSQLTVYYLTELRRLT